MRLSIFDEVKKLRNLVAFVDNPVCRLPNIRNVNEFCVKLKANLAKVYKIATLYW